MSWKESVLSLFPEKLSDYEECQVELNTLTLGIVGEKKKKESFKRSRSLIAITKTKLPKVEPSSYQLQARSNLFLHSGK